MKHFPLFSLAQGLTERFPWVTDTAALLLGLGLIGVMVIWYRRGAGGATERGFVIRVDEEDVTFAGQFPAQMQGMMIDFLRNDVQAGGAYEIRGRWEEDGANRILIVVVKGESARAAEQRIRNFLKLNLKAPRGG